MGVSEKISPKRIILDAPFHTKTIVSYGLMVHAMDTRRWLIIRRKHSIEFLILLRGTYRPSYLPILFLHITQEEAEILKRCLSDSEFFKTTITNNLELDSEGAEHAMRYLKESREKISELLENTDFSQTSLKWTWPKGRISYTNSGRETPLTCAKREFLEEVEIVLPPPVLISDSYVSENIKTINGQNMESRYWIYIIKNEIPVHPPFQHQEVSDRQWVSQDTCEEMLQYSTLFRKVLQYGY